MRLLGAAVLGAACFMAGRLTAPAREEAAVAVTARVDTIVVRQPSAESWTRLGVYMIPRADAQGTAANRGDSLGQMPARAEATLAEAGEGQEAGRAWVEGDSVALEVVQRHYRDSVCEAWVSGPIDPRLDSVRVYRPVTVVEMRGKAAPARWHLGVTAGCGYVPGRGMQPYVGVGVTYSIKSF